MRMRSQGGQLALKAELDGDTVDFRAAMEVAREKRVLWTAALKIQLARRAKMARKTLRRRKEERDEMAAAETEP